MIACLGEALIDLVPPAGASPGTAPHLTVQPGGAPLNVAVGLARLECPSLFLGCLSDDSFGQRLARVLDDAGVDRIPETFVSAPTRLAVVDHLNQVAPFRFYGDAPADSQLSVEDVQAAFDHGEISGLYVSSLMMLRDPGRAAQQFAIERARSSNVPVYSDPNPRPAAWPTDEAMIAATAALFEQSTLAKLSLDDSRALGWPTEPGPLFDWWVERFPGELFLTGGAAGCWALIAGELIHIRPPRIEPVDPTGAGDASFASLIAEFHSGKRLTESGVRFAAAAGSLAIQKPGAIAALPTREAVDRFLASWG